MKAQYVRFLSLFLAALLQLAPVLRSILPPISGLAPSAWAVVLKIGVGAVALLGFDAVSQASSISISPPNATVGATYVGVVTYSGGHAGSVSSMTLSNTCLSSLTSLFSGLKIQYLSGNQAQVTGTPITAGSYAFSITVWEGSGCGGGHSDTRATTLVIGASGGGAIAPSNPTLLNTIGQVGSDVSISGVSTGNPTPQYQWWTGLGTPIPGATNSTLTFNDLQLPNAGIYTLTASNSQNAGSTFFSLPKANCFLSVVITGGTNFTALNFTNYAPAGQPLTIFGYITNGTSTTTNHYSWTYNYVNTISTSNTVPLNATAVTPSKSGIYTISFNTANSGGAIVTGQNYDSYWAFGYPPMFPTPLPSTTNVSTGSSVTLSLPVAGSLNVYNALGGTGGFVTNADVPCVFWYRDATLVASQSYTCGPNSSITYSNTAAIASLTLTNLGSADSGAYTVVATNFWGSITSGPVMLTVASSGNPPVIVTDVPANLDLLTGQTAALNVTVTGQPPVSYQWRKDGTNLTDGPIYSGSLTNLLTITRAAITNSGGYSLAIANASGAITSSVANLLVSPPPPLAATAGGGNIQLTATTLTNLVYLVESTTNLSAPVWLPVLTNSTGGNGSVSFQTNASLAHDLFYRVAFP